MTLDPGSGMEKFGSGIQEKHPGSATLTIRMGLPPETEPFRTNDPGFLIDMNSTAGPDQGLLKGQKLVEN